MARRIKIGFTGTRKGMTGDQAASVARELIRIKSGGGVEEAHHGVCVGADVQFHELVRKLIPWAKLVGWPGIDREGNSPSRARSIEKDLDETMPEMRYRKRDEEIAKLDYLIAAPAGSEIRRSGTWATVRDARKLNTYRIIVLPSGEVIKEGH